MEYGSGGCAVSGARLIYPLSYLFFAGWGSGRMLGVVGRESLAVLHETLPHDVGDDLVDFGGLGRVA